MIPLTTISCAPIQKWHRKGCNSSTFLTNLIINGETTLRRHHNRSLPSKNVGNTNVKLLPFHYNINTIIFIKFISYIVKFTTIILLCVLVFSNNQKNNTFRDRTRLTNRVESEARLYARPLGRELPKANRKSERVPKVLLLITF